MDTVDINKSLERDMGSILGMAKCMSVYCSDNDRIEELVQEGVIAYIESARKFNDNNQAKLTTYAYPFVKRAMWDFILSNLSVVNTIKTNGQRKAFSCINRLSDNVGNLCEMEAESLSKKLCITECDVFAAESALTRRTINIDESTPDYDDAEKFIICHYGSSTKITEDNAQMLAIESVMDQLDDTKRFVIKERFLGNKKVTLKSLSEKMGISQAGVRHIESTAIDFLKEAANKALFKMSY